MTRVALEHLLEVRDRASKELCAVLDQLDRLGPRKSKTIEHMALRARSYALQIELNDIRKKLEAEDDGRG